MSIYLLMKLLHVLAAFRLIAGVVGRDFTFWQAGRANNVQSVHGLLQLSEFFERRAVIPVSMLVLLFGLVVTWMQKWPLFGFLQGAASNWLLVSFILFIGISAVIAPLRLIDCRRQRTKALENALAQGTITPELTAALRDKVVNRFRTGELTLLIVIIILMVRIPGSGKTLLARALPEMLPLVLIPLVLIPPLSNKGTDIKVRKGKSSRLFRFESNVTTNELWLDV